MKIYDRTFLKAFRAYYAKDEKRYTAELIIAKTLHFSFNSHRSLVFHITIHHRGAVINVGGYSLGIWLDWPFGGRA